MNATIAVEMPGKAFAEHYVQAAGYRIRYAQAGAGPALVYLPGSSGLTYAPGLDLLVARRTAASLCGGGKGVYCNRGAARAGGVRVVNL
jgi:hypothetical protein